MKSPMSNNENNNDLSRFATLQQEFNEPVNRTPDRETFLQEIVDSLQEIEELLILRNRLDRQGLFVVIVISIVFIAVSFIN